MIRHDIRVIFGDTDQMGVVYYANYLRYMEAGRNEFIRAHGLRYRDFEERFGLRLPVADAVGKQALIQGWVRTRRDSKAGFSFLEINDGSCQGNLQVVASNTLPNYEAEIKKLNAGSSVQISGEIKQSLG